MEVPVKQPKTPPAGTKDQNHSPTRDIYTQHQETFTTKTPPFSSDNESDEERTDTEEEQPQDHLSRGSVGAVSKTALTMEKNDDKDWSDVSELQEVGPGQLRSYRDPSKVNKICDLARKLKKHFAEMT